MAQRAEETISGTAKVFRFFRDLLVIVVIAFVASYALKTFLVRAFYIPSGSMKETLQVNDRILVNQLVPNVQKVDRGDIVVFRDPGGWVYPQAMPEANGFQKVLQQIGLAAEVTDEYVVKRVIGVGGDHVECCDMNGLMMINGVPIREPYVVMPEGATRVSEIDFDVTVPEGSVWVMGDNRYASKDSRYNQDQPGKGFVSEDEIVGRAFLLNWPLNRFGLLDSYSDVFAGLDDAKQGDGEPQEGGDDAQRNEDDEKPKEQ
ncbi:signal peptidase I [Leucobacter sp. UCMA 4100]|uniref:signal peptidase I n=1 Tax=Leucobacter sp. UCMA 4100 TaxID=2810534 RepID=UPI0022EA2F8A|nr:signal peptidase I [Leucobacter sp. UCMA 4100]MDA3148053.1 signal peptidase I [Leucobacter sp. UCMA 4100]